MLTVGGKQMAWSLPEFKAGDLVEVRSDAEILATLDEWGRLDGMPFMPEMLAYCGRQFTVDAVAHKTCDTQRQTYTGRRLNDTVHLKDLRCDGSAHAGCQAECLLFWKSDWLKPVSPSRASRSRQTRRGCTENDLIRATRAPDAPDGISYACQATQVYEASEALSPFDLRQYAYDVMTGNRTLRRTLRVTFLATLRWSLRRIPFGHRAFKAFHDRMHLLLTNRPAPSFGGKVPNGTPTPTQRLGLRAGELVRIKTKQEIEETLSHKSRNRGLGFDPDDMAPYCGRTVRVRKVVTQIIEEHTGKMLQMKEPCITLEGVVCNAEYAPCRLNCPRKIPSYWREIWLERVPTGIGSLASPDSPDSAELPLSQRLRPVGR